MVGRAGDQQDTGLPVERPLMTEWPQYKKANPSRPKRRMCGDDHSRCIRSLFQRSLFFSQTVIDLGTRDIVLLWRVNDIVLLEDQTGQQCSMKLPIRDHNGST